MSDYSNDDVFSDDEESSSGDDSNPEMQPSRGSEFSEFQAINVGGANIPGALVQALEKFMRENGSFNRNNKIPFSATISTEVHSLADKIYCQDEENVASAALYQVVDEITGGLVTQRFEKLKFEEKIIGYHAVVNFVNLLYTYIEPTIADDMDNTKRISIWMRVMIDMLQFHIDSYTDDYLNFCQTESIEPDTGVLEQHGWSSSHPYLMENLGVFKIADTKDNATKESLIEFFEHLLNSTVEHLKFAVNASDKHG